MDNYYLRLCLCSAWKKKELGRLEFKIHIVPIQNFFFLHTCTPEYIAIEPATPDLKAAGVVTLGPQSKESFIYKSTYIVTVMK